MSARDRYFFDPKADRQTADGAPYSGTIRYPELQRFGMKKKR
jgi:hypothetical protein